MIPDSIFLGYVHAAFVQGKFPMQVANLVMYEPNKIIMAGAASDPTAPTARNQVIEMFLESDAEWLLWIDDDARAFPWGPAQLREAAIDHGAILAHAFSVGHDPNTKKLFLGAWNFVPGDNWKSVSDPPEDPFFVEGVGCHFGIVHRNVYENLVEYPWHEHFDSHPATGKRMSHDLAFCYKLLGKAKILYVPSVKTQHIKEWFIGEEEWERFNDA